jgi:uncharacterized protein
MSNPCLSCGACCAAFRVDFSADELDSAYGQVPEGLAEMLGNGLARMRGTDYTKPRCAALQGTIGERAFCGIYEFRPSPCREFGVMACVGVGDPACQRARARHRLSPL